MNNHYVFIIIIIIIIITLDWAFWDHASKVFSGYGFPHSCREGRFTGFPGGALPSSKPFRGAHREEGMCTLWTQGRRGQASRDAHYFPLWFQRGFLKIVQCGDFIFSAKTTLGRQDTFWWMGKPQGLFQWTGEQSLSSEETCEVESVKWFSPGHLRPQSSLLVLL